MTAKLPQIKTWLAWLAQALSLLLRRWLGLVPKVVLVSLSGAAPGSAGDLRGVAVGQALRTHGWHALTLPPRLGAGARRVLCHALRPDAVLLQQTRHPLNRPELYPGVPCVLDVDDADVINPAERDRIADVARRCHGVVAGSRYLARLFQAFNPHVRIIWTGTYCHHVPGATPSAQRPPVLAWAPSDPFGYPLEMAFVRDVAHAVPNHGPFEFWVYGVPEARQVEMQAYLSHGKPKHLTLRLMPPMPYQDFIASLSGVAVGLQPVCHDHEYSLGKSFGKALAYLAADVAVVASRNVDHPLFFKDGRNARVLDTSPGSWAQACGDLLSQAPHRAALVQQARGDFMNKLTTTRSAAMLAPLLDAAATGQPWPAEPLLQSYHG